MKKFNFELFTPPKGRRSKIRLKYIEREIIKKLVEAKIPINAIVKLTRLNLNAPYINKNFKD